MGWGGIIASMYACGTIVDATLMECSCTLAALRCATLLARVGWGGVGWDNSVHVCLRN